MNVDSFVICGSYCNQSPIARTEHKMSICGSKKMFMDWFGILLPYTRSQKKNLDDGRILIMGIDELIKI